MEGRIGRDPVSELEEEEGKYTAETLESGPLSW